MTRADANALLDSRTNHLCVSYRERSDGEIVYAPERPRFVEFFAK